LPGIAAAMLGPAAVIGYLVCAVLVALVGLCLAEAGSRVISPGGLYAYAAAAWGPVAGGVAGTLLWAANSVAANAAVGNLFIDTVATSSPLFCGTAVRVVTLIALYVVLAVVNIRGTRSGTRLTTFPAGVKLAPLMLLIVVGIFSLKSSNLHIAGLPPATKVGSAAVIIFFAFMGIEGALNASGEVANPSRTVPRVILLSLTGVTMLYVGLQVVAQGALGASLAASNAPLIDTATTVFGPWGTRLLLLTTIVSTLGFLSADVLCSPRILDALAERGQLPGSLARVHPVFQTPSVAVGAYTAMCGSARVFRVVSRVGDCCDLWNTDALCDLLPRRVAAAHQKRR
jgi:amino acid transporter